jgi:hypothetical protein
VSERVVPAYLGWGNPERDTVGLRLYATDRGESPRWDREFKGGRVAEYALPGSEGDRYLIVHLGDRFTADEVAERVVAAIDAALPTTEDA